MAIGCSGTFSLQLLVNHSATYIKHASECTHHNQQKIPSQGKPHSTPSSQEFTAYVGISQALVCVASRASAQLVSHHSSGTVYNLGDHRERDDRPVAFVTVEPNAPEACSRAVHGGVHDEGQ